MSPALKLILHVRAMRGLAFNQQIVRAINLSWLSIILLFPMGLNPCFENVSI